MQAGPSVSCNARNKRSWWLPNGKILWMDEAFPDEIEKIRHEVDDGNEYVCHDYAIRGNVESDDSDDF